MTNTELPSAVERRAEQATKLEPFAVNLSEVRRTTMHMLGEIGKGGIFAQYTKHDISHIDELLQIAEWVVDEDSKNVMTSADWLMITLSIYFHDMGMLVTPDEFKNRDKSEFPRFKEEILNGADSSPEYVARINQLDQEERERFLYQEFVRKTHAIRIRRWIEGNQDTDHGFAHSAVEEVQRVIRNLDPTFKRDLALIAESHHLSDLDDLKKYNPRKAYGASTEETVNLQYCAMILRTVDLLHMRKDRTPSVLFRLINPSDPISQREWAKQNAIRRVESQIGKNEDGLPDEHAPRDTIEVHAHFSDESGFFGLTSFLTYVKSELRQSFKWNEICRRQSATKHRFIWKNIVDDSVETAGFLPKTFSFTLDQDKILDLLIGHTLYNDTSVVLRELVQNSIDAIRLKGFEDSSAAPGDIRICWNSKERLLTILDNGTGMTQDIIENHLLRVGSSRYQDSRFREQHPDFSPISRFGIGVLSAFMVSDDMEITTCSTDDDVARRISLRSVHGRYLIRLLDKKTEAREIFPHGTMFQLRIR